MRAAEKEEGDILRQTGVTIVHLLGGLGWLACFALQRLQAAFLLSLSHPAVPHFALPCLPAILQTCCIDMDFAGSFCHMHGIYIAA